MYSQKNFSQFTEVTTIVDNDIFLIWQTAAGANKKVTFSTIKSVMSLPYVNVTANSVKIGNGAGTTETGSNNVLIGTSNAGNNINGSNNVVIGSAATNLIGSNNFIAGTGAAVSATTSFSVAVGNNNSASSNGDFNTSHGNAAFNQSVGDFKCGYGGSAGAQSTKDYGNFFGYVSGVKATGDAPNFFGSFSGAFNTGSFNSLYGDSVAYLSSGSYWSIFGNQSFTPLYTDTFIGNNVTSFGFGNNSTDSAISHIVILGDNIIVENDSTIYLGNVNQVYKMFGDSTLPEIIRRHSINTTPQTEFVYGGDDAGYTLPLTLNTYTKFTNASNSQFSQDNNNVLAIVADSAILAETGDYEVTYNITGQADAGTDCNITFKIVKNGSTQVGEFVFSTMRTGTARGGFTITGIYAFTANDYFELQIQNTTNSDDFVIGTGTLKIIKM